MANDSSERTPSLGVPPGFAADPVKVEAVKKKLIEAGVRTCFATFVDIHGVPKAKATPLRVFEKMCNGQELYTVGANEGLGLAGPHEDECATVPDLDSLIILPWDSTQAWFNADLYYHGAPYANDPRAILRRVIAKAEAMGFRFNLGIEPEFYVLKRNQEGALGPITQTAFKGPNACYDVALATESAGFLQPMADYLEELGWGLYSYDQECGRGQHEFDFGYTDALTMADRFVFFRFMAKKAAQSVGALATFMPKPFSEDFRSGAHFKPKSPTCRRGRARASAAPEIEQQDPENDAGAADHLDQGQGLLEDKISGGHGDHRGSADDGRNGDVGGHGLAGADAREQVEVRDLRAADAEPRHDRPGIGTERQLHDVAAAHQQDGHEDEGGGERRQLE